MRDAAQARADLDALAGELHAGLPQGGRLPREVEAIRSRVRAAGDAVRRQSSSDGCIGSIVPSPRITFLNSARETDT